MKKKDGKNMGKKIKKYKTLIKALQTEITKIEKEYSLSKTTYKKQQKKCQDTLNAMKRLVKNAHQKVKTKKEALKKAKTKLKDISNPSTKKKTTASKKAKANSKPKKKKTAPIKPSVKKAKSNNLPPVITPLPKALHSDPPEVAKKRSLKSSKSKKVSITDNLKRIEGIGPKIEGLLKAAGIKTFGDLGKSKISTLREILHAAGPRYKMHNPSTWAQQSRLAAKGQWDKLKALQDKLDGGKRK